MKPKQNIIIMAILAITLLEGIALINGINGQLFTFVIAVLAGLAGLVSPQLKLKAEPSLDGF